MLALHNRCLDVFGHYFFLLRREHAVPGFLAHRGSPELALVRLNLLLHDLLFVSIIIVVDKFARVQQRQAL